jgi:HK97 family phage prohead protease/HK97 family phage major capsid protein
MSKDKVLFVNSTFTAKELPAAGDKIDSIFIEGYASTNDVDRSNDVIPTSVWEAGIKNYLKNPIILAQHDHDDPIGRMVEHKIDGKGLWIKARISAAAEIFSLVKDEVVTAFSVGFRIIDAEYNAVAELFVVKELELVEISVVSVPCNQNTLFSLSKAFSDADEYNNFKSQFAPKSASAKGLDSSTDVNSKSQKEVEMTQDEIKQLVADATAKALADQATAKSLADAQEADVQARIKAAVALATPSTTGADKLMAEVEARFATQAASTKSVLDGLQAALTEKAAEIEAMQKSKMTFADGKTAEVSYADKEKAVILSRITGKSIQDTKFGRQLLEKTGAHLPSATWELEVSMAMEAEVRRKLIVSPLLRNVAMQTNVMTIPVNPEAGYATWVTNAQFATAASAGGTQVHQVKEITLNAYKVATNEYMAYEEEEDSLIALMPIVRDAMVRRTARAIDKAFLLGAGAGADPVKGLATYTTGVAAANTTSSIATGAATSVASLRALRKALGALGLDPQDVTFIVSTEMYYNLLEDTTFQTMNQVGPQATLLTGQIGQVGNSPVLVSAELPTQATGAYGALAVYTPNFIVGNQRGLRMDTQELVETQRRVLVASLRTGMTQIATNLGQGVATMKWAA